MDAQQEVALRITKEAVKICIRDIETAFGPDGGLGFDICIDLAGVLDKIDKRISEHGMLAAAYAEAARRRNSL